MNKEHSFGTFGLPSQGKLEPRQLELWKSLVGIDEKFGVKPGKRIGDMYMGCLSALMSDVNGRRNPEFLVHAALSLREIIDKLHLFYNFPIPSYKLKNSLEPLAIQWLRLKDERGDFLCGPDRLGLLPKKTLNRLLVFLKKLQDFFDDFNAAYPSVKSRAKGLFGSLDPRSDELSKSIQDTRVKEWKDYWSWFNDVVHHRKPDVREDEFREQLFRFEVFLSGLISPSYRGITELEKIIDKAKDE